MRNTLLLVAAMVGLAAGTLAARQTPQDEHRKFRFRTGVELINVTATVTDRHGRFVSGLRKEDFRVYQDDEPQPITHFDNERVPVSLGIVLDTSGSMAGEKMAAAREALHRFLFDLLGRDDEVFLYRFDGTPQLVEGWTTDRRRIADELARIKPGGATALYDAVAEAVPLAQAGRHRKKALVIISDGHDTSSHIDLPSLKGLIRETEVLVYAIGIDAQETTADARPRRSRWPLQVLAPLRQTVPVPLPFPKPGRRPPAKPPRVPDPRGPIGTPRPHPIPPMPSPIPQPQPPGPQPPVSPHPTTTGGGKSDRVNAVALREITDDSGGRTEIIHGARDLHPATAGIAHELNQQYYLGYPATGVKDGRWHSIRVEVRNSDHIVRARRGFIATP